MMRCSEILKGLKAHANPKNVEGMARFGINPKNTYGVQIPVLRNRHWSKYALIGYLLIVFLANFLINLTLFLAPKPIVRNVKLLKKYLNNLTLTVVYPKNRFKLEILSNISEEIRSILGDFVRNYGDRTMDLRF